MFLFLLLYPGCYKRRLCCVSHLDALTFTKAGAGREAAGEDRGNAEIERETGENPEGAGGFSLLQLVEVSVHLLPSLPTFDLP